MIVYSNNKARLLWLVKPRDTESLQSKRYMKKFIVSQYWFIRTTKHIVLWLMKLKEKQKSAAMRALIERRSISLLE